MLIVTTNDIPGHRVVRTIGVVRGITVRSRSIVGNLGGAIQSVFGGKLSIYVNLAETTTTVFVIRSQGTALAASTAYQWHAQIVQ